METQDQENRVPEWRVVINGLLYTVQFDESLDEQVVTEVADLIEQRTVLEGGKDLHAKAIKAALAHSYVLTSFIPEAHGEIEFRDFLARLLRSLEDR